MTSKGIIFLLATVLVLHFKAQAQQTIIHRLDVHQRIWRYDYGDSNTITTGYDAAHNPTQTIISNPCLDRPVPVIIYSGANAICAGDSIILSAPKAIKYKWSRGDTTQSIKVKSAGAFFVAITGTLNCVQKSLPVSVKVNPLPKPTIIASGDTVFCENISVTLTSSLTGTYLWNTGAKTKSVTLNSSTYAQLKYTDSNGCWGVAYKKVIVNPMPKVKFAIDDSLLCLKSNNPEFKNLTSGFYNSFKWQFGDGTSNNVSGKLNHKYKSYGTYQVKLIFTTDKGCTDSASKWVEIYPQVKSGFSINTDEQCLVGNNFAFKDTGNISSGNYTTKWAYGDSNTSTGKSVNHHYGNYGSYTVTNYTTTSNGCLDTLSKTITINPNPKSKISVVSDSLCFKGHRFYLADSSSIPADSLSLSSWNFGDTTSGFGKSVSKSYKQPYGTYTVRLVSGSSIGCYDTAYKNLTIMPSPKASFSINTIGQCERDNSFNFTNQSTIGTGSMAHSWILGDGNTATSNDIANKVYTNGIGTYIVRLIETSPFDCKDTTSKQIAIYSQNKPALTVNKDSQCLTGNYFKFTNKSSLPIDSIAKYTWQFGDGQSKDSTNAMHRYSASSNYYGKLISVTNNGCKDTIAFFNRVNHQTQIDIALLDSLQCLKGNYFEFKNNSTASGDNFTSNWDFGDSKTSSSTSPNHIYTAHAPVYTVRLITKTQHSCIDTSYTRTEVYPQAVPDYTTPNWNQCLNGNSYVFTQTTTMPYGSIANSNWQFDDGNTSALTSPSYTYLTDDTFTVQLATVTNYGCLDTINKSVIVYPQTTVKIGVLDSALCYRDNKYYFTNGSQLRYGSASWLWTFDDSRSDTSNSPTHSYKSLGTYTVKTVSTTNFGCMDSALQIVTVDPQVDINLLLDTNSICFKGNIAKMYDGSTLALGSYTRRWYFGEGSKYDTALTVQHQYLGADTFKIRLNTITDKGCADEDSTIIFIRPQAELDFVTNKDSQCLKANILQSFNNSSIDHGNLLYTWAVGSDSVYHSANFSHKFTKAELYNVNLYSVSNFNCRDTIKKEVRIWPQSSANASVNFSYKCLSTNRTWFQNRTSFIGKTPNYIWYFGDGDSSTTESLWHAYNTAGEFKCNLTVTNQWQCKDTWSGSVTIYPMPVLKNPLLTPARQCYKYHVFAVADNTVYPTGDAVGTVRWVWSNTSVENSLSSNERYTVPGNYTVKHIVTTKLGCMDSASYPLSVDPTPNISYSFNRDSQCLKENSFVAANTTTIYSGSIKSYIWDFWDKTYSTLKNPTKTYSAAKGYLVTLVAESDNGCRDTAYRPIFVMPQVLIKPYCPDTVQCFNWHTFRFVDSSGSNPAHSTVWQTGDGEELSGFDVIHSYNNTGRYIVLEITKTDFGCLDTGFVSVLVHPSPEKPVIVRRVNYLATISKFERLWHVNGDSIPFEKDSMLWLSKTGTYSLVVRNDVGCMDTSDYREIKNLNAKCSIGLGINPNPNEGRFEVGADVQLSQIEIYDMVGKILFKTNSLANGLIETISIDLPSATYVLRALTINNEFCVLKFIVE